MEEIQKLMEDIEENKKELDNYKQSISEVIVEISNSVLVCLHLNRTWVQK